MHRKAFIKRAVAARKFLKRDEYLQEVVALLVKLHKPIRIYLFGSRARDQAGPDSDYDLMVVVHKKVSSKERRKFHEARARMKKVEATDVLFWTQESFETQLSVQESFPSTVVEEGVLLYEAA